MPRTTVTRRRPSRRGVRAARESSTWVRKNILMDQKKLDEAKRVLKTATETETIDAALDEIAFRHGLVAGMRALKRSGGLKDLFRRALSAREVHLRYQRPRRRAA
jgi:hypothetical protein